MSHHSSGGPENYEKTDIWPGVVWISLAALTFFILAGIAISFVSYEGLEAWFKRGDKALAPMMQANVLPPEPRLQVKPALDWAEFKQSQQKPLNSYAWVDQEAGTARIPIKRAMEILIEKKPAEKQPEAAVTL